MRPAAGEDRHVRKSVHGDVYMPPMLPGSHAVNEPELRPEELRAFPKALYEVCSIVPELTDAFRLLVLAVGKGHGPEVPVIEVRVHELAELVRPVPHVRPLYPFRCRIQPSASLAFRHSSGTDGIITAYLFSFSCYDNFFVI